MGRSKKSGQAAAAAPVVSTSTVLCYFCDREFEDERVLIQHQLNKHFRCADCPRTGLSGKCNTLHGLIIHYRKVHIAELKTVPNALPGRDDPASGMQIFGERNVPEEILQEWRERKGLQNKGIFVDVAVPVPEASIFQLQEPSTLGELPPLPAGLPPLPSSSLPPLPSGNLQSIDFSKIPGLPEAAPPLPPSGPSDESDLAKQVKEWMMKKQLEEEVAPPLPPVPEPQEFSQPMDMNPAFPSSSLPQGPLPGIPPVPQSFDGFQNQPFAVQQPGPPLGFSAAAPAPQPSRLDPAASSAIEAALQTAQLAKSFASQASNMSAMPPPAQASRQRSHSRDRRDNRGRSGSRDAYREPRREPPREPARQAPQERQDPFDSRTIQITGAIVGSRLWLKKEMDRFGRVEVCHTGNRQNPEAEPPWVRFEKITSAQLAVEAINSGQVLLDGAMLKANFKREGGRAADTAPRFPRSARGDLEVTSRDLARDDRRRDPPREQRRRWSPPPADLRNRMATSRDLAMTDRRRDWGKHRSSSGSSRSRSRSRKRRR